MSGGRGDPGQNGDIDEPSGPQRDTLEDLRTVLGGLGASIRRQVSDHRTASGIEHLQSVAGRVEADVIYGVDRVSEDAVLEWFAEHWPRDQVVRLVMEGIEDHVVVTFPPDAGADAVRWVCIIDPVDGTRNLMYDKRAAWVLTALAPARTGADGLAGARLGDIELAVMTEIPTSKQGWADQVSARRGQGSAGVVAHRIDVRSGAVEPVTLTPSRAQGFEHGFCSLSHALPDGKALLAAIDQALWDRLVPPRGDARSVFEDQYLCSAGQLYEVASGHDRFVGDLRPLVSEHLGTIPGLVAHPYDVCTALVLTESGGVFEDPWGGPVDVPLDTTSPVAFMAYANPGLAAAVRPALAAAITEVLGTTPP